MSSPNPSDVRYRLSPGPTVHTERRCTDQPPPDTGGPHSGVRHAAAAYLAAVAEEAWHGQFPGRCSEHAWEVLDALVEDHISIWGDTHPSGSSVGDLLRAGDAWRVAGGSTVRNLLDAVDVLRHGRNALPIGFQSGLAPSSFGEVGARGEAGS